MGTTPRHTCLLFGEGKAEIRIINTILSLSNFHFHAKAWNFSTDNTSGGHPETILTKCASSIKTTSYDLVICFVDCDLIMQQYPKNYRKKMKELEDKYPKIHIFWQENKLEDELRKIFGNQNSDKRIISLAKKQKEKFINSMYVERLLKILNDTEGQIKKTQQLKHNNL